MKNKILLYIALSIYAVTLLQYKVIGDASVKEYGFNFVPESQIQGILFRDNTPFGDVLAFSYKVQPIENKGLEKTTLPFFSIISDFSCLELLFNLDRQFAWLVDSFLNRINISPYIFPFHYFW